MCWVMPPASPATTSVERMASSSEVLPWSTWPMTVTTGARGTQRGRIVGDVEQAFLDVGFGDALDGVAEFLGDELGGVGVDHVVDLHHLALLHQKLDDVDGALGHAVGEFLDGDRLRDRDLADELFLGLAARWPWCAAGCGGGTRRPERSRTSSAVSAVTSVSRPRGFSARGARRPWRAAPGAAAPPGPRRKRGASSSSASSTGRAPEAGLA